MILSLDGGATKTVAIVFDDDNFEISGIGVSGPSNFASINPRTASKNISKAINDALNVSGTDIRKLKKGIFGIAGIGDSKEFNEMGEKIVNDVTGRKDFLKFNDGVLAYTLANLNEEGIVFAGGTGSVAFYYKNGKLGRLGGWNWFVGDDGSASWISKRALNLATMEYDNIYPEGKIIKAAENYFGNEFREVIAFLEKHQDKRKIAGFAPYISALAKEGYQPALSIFRESSEYVRKLILSNIQNFAKAPKISLVGGTMLAGSFYTDMITKDFESEVEIFYGYQVAIGGILLLLRSLGYDVDYILRNKLIGDLDRMILGKNKSRFERYLNTKL